VTYDKAPTSREVREDIFTANRVAGCLSRSVLKLFYGNFGLCRTCESSIKESWDIMKTLGRLWGQN
jgi:hypothetical protein